LTGPGPGAHRRPRELSDRRPGARRDPPATVTGAARHTDDLTVEGARERGGREAVITCPQNLLDAVRGRAGAHIVKDEYQP